jgi:putative membrane protein
MIRLILRYIAVAAAIVVVVAYVPGIGMHGGWMTLALVAALWSAIITVIKPILNILTLPVSFLTLGLSSFVLNVALFWVMTLIIPQFTIAGIIPAVVGSFVLTLLSWVITSLF